MTAVCIVFCSTVTEDNHSNIIMSSQALLKNAQDLETGLPVAVLKHSKSADQIGNKNVPLPSACLSRGACYIGGFIFGSAFLFMVALACTNYDTYNAGTGLLFGMLCFTLSILTLIIFGCWVLCRPYQRPKDGTEAPEVELQRNTPQWESCRRN